MAWARLDDGFGNHPKALDLIDTLPELEGAAAIGLWTLALAYANKTMRTAKEPGYIPRSFARGRARVPAYIGDRLVSVGLWEVREGGWSIYGDADLFKLDSGTRREKITDFLRRKVYDRDGHACLRCGARHDLTLDHIYPWSLGGPDTFENLQTLCRPCNSSKGAKV